MVAVAAVLCVFCGCSQDDDMYNNSDMYTLAEEMGTRSMGGDPGGGVKKKPVVFQHKYGGFLNQPRNIIDSTEPTLYGEYDTDTLAVSINNYDGLAKIYVANGNIVMDSIITNVSSGCSSIFSLTGYTSGESYHVDVVLKNDTYIGDLDL